MTAFVVSPWLVWALCAACGGSAALAGYALAHGASLRLDRWSFAYADSLDAPLRRMLRPARGRLILGLQLSCIVPLVLGAAALRAPALGALGLVIAGAPALIVRRAAARRRARLEAKLDGFALALANATRATPSVGRALLLLRGTLTAPLDREVDQILRELRLGSSLEQALSNFSWRVQSQALDALLSAVLIARRVGGQLPAILETTAATLREMARLEGVLRAKTAQARVQLWVLATLPPGVLLAFRAVQPGYFQALTDTLPGHLLGGLAVACWLAAIVLARRILAVSL